MKKISIIFFLLIISASVHSQTKYLIYFKDKGVSQSNSLQKSSALFKLAEKELSERAIERRKQVMGEDNYITYEDIPLNENYIHQIEKSGIKIENKLKWFNAVSAYLTDEQLKSIKSLSSIQKIEKVRVFKSRNDESKLNESSANNSNRLLNKISSTTGLNYGPSITQNALSDIPTVHDLGINGNNVIIGILDTGFRWKSHNSLKNLLVLNEKDFIQNDGITENQTGDASGQDSHGTAVFSIMAGFDQGNIVGPAYGAQFLLAKTEYVPSETHTEEDNYAAALEWMEAQGVQITSSSLGYSLFDVGQSSYTYADMNGQTTIVAKAANLAFERGVSTFTSAGNEGSYWGNGNGGIVSPADALNIIAVGAVTSNNIVASFSSRGPTSDGRIKPEVAAMGVSDFHAVAGSTYGSGSGTSYAAPIAAGIAALLKSCWPHLTNVQIRKIFLESGDNTASPNNDRGWGLISAKKAICYPNLEKIGSQYKIHKIFLDSRGVDSTSVLMIINVPGYFAWDPVIVYPSYDGFSKYSHTFSSLPQGYQIQIQFYYMTKNRIFVTDPSSGAYKFYWGNLLISDVPDNNNIVLPTQFSLSQNYPNPFNPSTVISWQLAVGSIVTLKVYDLLGREVATLVNEFQLPGNYHSTF
ncbi:MAG: S8 family serine peptidase, partial [Bacteroidota bacterium]